MTKREALLYTIMNKCECPVNSCSKCPMDGLCMDTIKAIPSELLTYERLTKETMKVYDKLYGKGSCKKDIVEALI